MNEVSEVEHLLMQDIYKLFIRHNLAETGFEFYKGTDNKLGFFVRQGSRKTSHETLRDVYDVLHTTPDETVVMSPMVREGSLDDYINLVVEEDNLNNRPAVKRSNPVKTFVGSAAFGFVAAYVLDYLLGVEDAPFATKVMTAGLFGSFVTARSLVRSKRISKLTGSPSEQLEEVADRMDKTTYGLAKKIDGSELARNVVPESMLDQLTFRGILSQ